MIFAGPVPKTHIFDNEKKGNPNTVIIEKKGKSMRSGHKNTCRCLCKDPIQTDTVEVFKSKIKNMRSPYCYIGVCSDYLQQRSWFQRGQLGLLT